MTPQTSLLIAVSVTAGIYAILFPYFGGSDRAEKRVATAAATASQRAAIAKAKTDLAKRRKIITENLREATERSQRKLTFENKLSQAGLEISKVRFLIFIGIFTALVAGGVYVALGDPLVAFGIGFASLVALPNMILSFLRKRRMTRFLTQFPQTLDMVTRGVRAGLPVTDCFKMVASDAQEPVRTEFDLVIQSLSVGVALSEATERLAIRLPMPETTFFATAVSIQQSSGGNLSEALSNLANVLRQRKAMREKVAAISSEAKVSAIIIGAMPFLVTAALVYVNPEYIMVLFTTTVGNYLVAAAGALMLIGVIIMRQMIKFDV
jgi:tight adherence protein B